MNFSRDIISQTPCTGNPQKLSLLKPYAIQLMVRELTILKEMVKFIFCSSFISGSLFHFTEASKMALLAIGHGLGFTTIAIDPVQAEQDNSFVT